MGFTFPRKIVYLGRLYNLRKVYRSRQENGVDVGEYEGEDFDIRLRLAENLFRYHENCGNIERRQG